MSRGEMHRASQEAQRHEEVQDPRQSWGGVQTWGKKHEACMLHGVLPMLLLVNVIYVYSVYTHTVVYPELW